MGKKPTTIEEPDMGKYWKYCSGCIHARFEGFIRNESNKLKAQFVRCNLRIFEALNGKEVETFSDAAAVGSMIYKGMIVENFEYPAECPYSLERVVEND